MLFKEEEENFILTNEGESKRGKDSQVDGVDSFIKSY